MTRFPPPPHAICMPNRNQCQLPAMAEAVGKKVFKRHLDVFLKPLFDTLSRFTTTQLARHAAASCVRQLSAFVGPSIFRGRLTDAQREVMTNEPVKRLHSVCGAVVGVVGEGGGIVLRTPLAWFLLHGGIVGTVCRGLLWL